MTYIDAEEEKMDLELRRLAEFIPDEEMPTESYNRIWNNIDKHLQPSVMNSEEKKDWLLLLSSFAIGILTGIVIALAVYVFIIKS